MISEVRYTLRRNLGNYEHEELSATVVAGEGENKTGAEMMGEARKLCIMNTTSYLRKQEAAAVEGHYNDYIDKQNKKGQ